MQASTTAYTRRKTVYDLSCWLPLLVGISASIVAFNAQYEGFFNPYIINGDVPQHIYWMQQFRDSELFKNDLLTEFAKSIQPWGAVFVYRLFASVIEPLFLCKILPVVLCAISSVYLFKLLRHLAGPLAGLIGAALFLVMPVFQGVLAGGTPRAYSYPLIISFLYFLSRRDYFKTAVVLVLQPLFYPSVFFICGLTFFLTLLGDRSAVVLQLQLIKVRWFIVSVVIGISILGAKYILASNSDLGGIVTKQQVENWPELGVNGRYAIIPTSPIHSALMQQTRATLMSFITESPLYFASRLVRPDSVHPGQIKDLLALICPFVFAALTLFVLLESRKGQFRISAELIYLFIASLVMYVAADWLFLRLWLPARYIQYSIPLIIVMILSIAMMTLIDKLRPVSVRNICACALLIVLGLHFDLNKNVGMDDQSANQELFKYMETLPKDALIAAHPATADYIPTFSRRKVFLNYELSQPYVDKYWFAIRARTFEFFDAYYSSDGSEILRFCAKHNIDYLVVDRRHFSPTYLKAKKVYFEPFNSYIKELMAKQARYAILDLPGKHTELPGGLIFVIDVRRLRV